MQREAIQRRLQHLLQKNKWRMLKMLKSKNVCFHVPDEKTRNTQEKGILKECTEMPASGHIFRDG